MNLFYCCVFFFNLYCWVFVVMFRGLEKKKKKKKKKKRAVCRTAAFPSVGLRLCPLSCAGGWRILRISKRAPCTARKRLHFQPQFSCRDGRIDPRLSPPCYIVAATVDLAMVASTQGNSELVADLAAERPALAIAQMTGIARLATANQARMLGDVPDVVAVSNPARLRQCQNGLVDPL